MQRNQVIFRKNTHPGKSNTKTQKNNDLHGFNGFTKKTPDEVKIRS